MREIIIPIVLLVIVIAIVTSILHFNATAPCEDFSNMMTKDIPVRCLKYYSK